jgi:hypothetical protein
MIKVKDKSDLFENRQSSERSFFLLKSQKEVSGDNSCNSLHNKITEFLYRTLYQICQFNNTQVNGPNDP